jgi:putative acetyltransferase
MYNSPLELQIRPERHQDIAGIHALNVETFHGPAEADLVDRLRGANGLLLSLVAEANREIVGHIGFSPVTIVEADRESAAVGLAPMAVIPVWQKSGIGTLLVEEGLAELRRLGNGVVVVLGHPEYYARFGFQPSVTFGIRWQHEVPPEIFMALALRPGALAGVRGVVHYRPEFDGM